MNDSKPRPGTARKPDSHLSRDFRNRTEAVVCCRWALAGLKAFRGKLFPKDICFASVLRAQFFFWRPGGELVLSHPKTLYAQVGFSSDR